MNLDKSKLIQDLASNDVEARRNAFWLLADSFRPELRKVAESYRVSLQKHVRDGGTPADLVSDALAKLAMGRITEKPWDLRDDGDDWERSFVSYLKTTIENLANGRLRYQGARSHIQDREDLDESGAPVEINPQQGRLSRSSLMTERMRREDDERHIRQALASLPDLDADIHELLIARYVEGMSYVQIAGLGLGRDAAKEQVDKEADKLRQQVNRADIPEELRHLMESFKQCLIGY